MANPERAEVELTLQEPLNEGGSTSLTFRIRSAEAMTLEDVFKKKFPQIAVMIDQGLGFNDLSVFLRVGLERHHGNLNRAQLAEVMDQVGAIKLVEAIGRAIERGFPDLVEAGLAAQGKAQGGTGASSAAHLSPPD